MKLISKSSGELVCGDVREASLPHEKLRGLIGGSGEYGLIFKTRWGIHTFGMKFTIDVLVLDGESKVVRVRKNMRPNRFFFWNPKYSKVIEIPSSIDADVKEGDVLSFEN